MIKKILSMLVILGMVFFVQCTDDSVTPVQEATMKAGGPGGGGGGGHIEVTPNNLSFPAILLDGYPVAEVTEDIFSVVYDGDYEGLTAEQIAFCEANGPWYPQKTEGNVWQADYGTATTIDINWIDWGDAIEAVNPKIGRPYRLELVLYVDNLAPTMTAYTMAELEFPSSKNELQGTNTITYESSVAAVASTAGEIVVQRFEGVDPATLTWDAISGQWLGAEAPIPVNFAMENNVGGKLIFGASKKGWKPKATGDFRITFYISSGNVNISTADIGNYNGDGATFTPVEAGETNTPVVDVMNNLTYVDVIVTTGGGGGGGGGG
jgi:hypothetical protein